MCLPPHANHVLQPLDVTCYGPLKQVWRQTLKDFKIKSGAMHVTKVEFPALLKEVWENGLLAGHLQNHFKCCGLHPLPKRAVSDSKLTPALIILSIYIDTTVKRKGKASNTSKKSTATSKRKPVIIVEGTLHKPILAIYAGYIFTLHSFYLQFLSLKMMGCALKCKNTVDDKHWVACDQCNLWYHLSCTDLDESPGPDDALPQCALTSKPSHIHLNCCFAAIYC